ncbi:hypothetical protein [Bradyrhizobium sp.]|uniref:hypothetical protein n=1 Tax=Bradyrhizobium sp. TaxID=376 RepID=UPI00271EAD1D|nr:hypothetical protein [Bradyrhizobium sp.]MDO9298985.1 hypothetical protein [Bradyrhizobium sp.]
MFSQFVGRRGAKSSGWRLMAILVSAFFVGVLMATSAQADPPSAKPPANPAIVDWGGLGWGIGVATNFDIGGRRVGTADIVNDLVRVKDASSNVGVSFVLEAHYFLRDYQFKFGNSNCQAGTFNYYNCTEVAHGPFVALEVGGGSSAKPGADGIISALAMGWMVGLRHPGSSGDNNYSSWNFGLGLRVTPNSQVLGDGVIANQPLPAGETVIRYKTEPRYGVMLMSSFSF